MCVWVCVFILGKDCICLYNYQAMSKFTHIHNILYNHKRKICYIFTLASYTIHISVHIHKEMHKYISQTRVHIPTTVVVRHVATVSKCYLVKPQCCRPCQAKFKISHSPYPASTLGISPHESPSASHFITPSSPSAISHTPLPTSLLLRRTSIK